LIRLIPDAYLDGKEEVPGVDDKRLLVAESEFANVLHQNKREGNTLSAALRDCWDGGDLKPATKQNVMWTSNPHIGIMGAITPHELKSLIASRDLTNGFFNRFLVIFAERRGLVPIPTGTPQGDVDDIADRIVEILQFCQAERWVERDHTPMVFSPEARAHYEHLYLGELNDNAMGERIAALIQRRAPMVLRLAMLFALCDLTTTIEVHHLDAAMAWVRYAVDSVKYIFSSGADEAKMAETQANAQKILAHLAAKGQATRTTISCDCFGKHKTKQELDEALDELLHRTPPSILVEETRNANGRPSKTYRLTKAECAKQAKLLSDQEISWAEPGGEAREYCEETVEVEGSRRILRNDSPSLARGGIGEPSMLSLSSQAAHDDGVIEEWDL
jgi:hypothetical protein